MKDLEAQIKAKEAGASEEVKQLKEQLRNAKLKVRQSLEGWFLLMRLRLWLQQADESKALSEAAYKQLSEAKEELAQMEADLEDLEEKVRRSKKKRRGEKV